MHSLHLESRLTEIIIWATSNTGHSIIGPTDGVSGQVIEDLLHESTILELVDRTEWLVGGVRQIVELSFASIRGQSRAAYKTYLDYIKKNGLQGRRAIRWARILATRRGTITTHIKLLSGTVVEQCFSEAS
jgi:hypothetical protein